MTDTPRYALYYAPAPRSVLGRFGAHLLGYDAFSRKTLRFPVNIEQALPDWGELTQDPRKYGFHATLKAPMVLADGKSEAELLAACETFAQTSRSIPAIAPVINEIGDFIAIVPSQPSAELQALAADAVRHFDSFRAPLTAWDRARREPERLPPRQRDYLERWGYPYVMEEFRFHMTLTGRLPAERRKTVLAILRQRFAALNMSSIAVDRLALFKQSDSSSGFQIVRQYSLTAGTGLAPSTTNALPNLA
jgi:putative phosphonate metabolism protein